MWSDEDLLQAQRRHRDALTAQIKGSASSGLITSFDQELLLRAATNAATRGELGQIRSDLERRISTSRTTVIPAGEQHAQDEAVVDDMATYGNPRREVGSRLGSPKIAQAVVIGVAILLVLVIVLSAYKLVTGVSVSSGSAASASDFGKTHLLDKDGLWSLTTALKKEFDSSRVVSATIYDSYATIIRHAPGNAEQLAVYRYDGATFTRLDEGGAAGAEVPMFEFADVDAPNVAGIVDSTPRRIGLEGDTTSWIVARVAVTKGGKHRTRLWINARNARGEAGHVRCTDRGRVLATVPAR